MKGQKRECPREAYVQASVPSGITKHAVMRSIMKEACLTVIPGTTSTTAIKSFVYNAFQNSATLKNSMLPFEAEEEAKRMGILLARWVSWENTQIPRGKVVKTDFSNEFPFAGSKKSKTVHMLMDRGTYFEAICFNCFALGETIGNDVIHCPLFKASAQNRSGISAAFHVVD